jgi:hypothetical protein
VIFVLVPQIVIFVLVPQIVIFVLVPQIVIFVLVPSDCDVCIILSDCDFYIVYLLVWFMVFNATFNNISVISAEETRVPGENHQPVASHIMLYRVHLAMNWVQIHNC